MNDTVKSSPKCPRCGATLATDAPDGLCPRCLMALNLAPVTEAANSDGPPGGTVQVQLTAPPPIAEVARHFPHLEILDCLGRGGMGVVYKARQPKLNRLVALKILAPGKENDPKFAERFVREAQALARLNHPNIVAVYDFGETNGLCYLLMEYVGGVNLRQLLRTQKLAPEQALAVVPKICDALQYAHEQGVVHRDIKPENVLLDQEGRVKIADFGIAKILREERPQPALTEDQQVIGTPHYMAPEQVEKPQTVDHRADIYSLGVVFYEMLTGELPLGKFAPPSSLMSGVRVDVRLDQVVLHALEKAPERRYQHASEVKTDLENIAAAPPAPLATSRPAIQQQVQWPATGLLLTGILNWLLIPMAMFIGMTLSHAADRPSSTLMAVLGLTSLGLCSFIIYASFKLRRLEAYWACVAASFLAMVVTPGNFVGLPLGIWSLVVLNRKEVRAAFAATASQNNSAGPHGPRWRKVVMAGLAAVAIALLLRQFVLAPYRAATDAASPAIPHGSHVLVYKLARNYAPGDVIVYQRDGLSLLGRVVKIEPNRDTALIERLNQEPQPISLASVVGRVVFNTRASENSAIGEKARHDTNVVTTKDSDYKKAVRRVELQQAETELQRVSQLFDQKIVSDTELELARHNVAVRKAELAGDPVQVARARLAFAEMELKKVNTLYEQKIATSTDLEFARDNVAILKAEVEGDPVLVARAKLAAAEREFQRASELFQAKVLSATEYEAAKNKVELRQAELDQILSESAPTPGRK